MTINEMLVKKPIEHGFFEDQAEVVMEMVKKDEAAQCLHSRFQKSNTSPPEPSHVLGAL